MSIKDCCRICLLGAEDMTNIYEKIILPHGKTFVEMLIECSNLRFTRHDHVPYSVCNNCAMCAKITYEFIRRCEEAESNWVQKIGLVHEASTNNSVDFSSEFLQKFENVNNADSLPEKATAVLQLEDDIFRSDVSTNCERAHLSDSNLDKKVTGADDDDYDDEFEQPLSCLMIKMEAIETERSKERDKLNAAPAENISDCNPAVIKKTRKSTENHPAKKRSLSKFHSKKKVNSKSALQLKSDRSKQYQCEYCEKIFRRSYVLNRHLLSHGQERQYACSHCDKTFKRNDHLKIHVMRMHERKDYKCTDCSKEYTDAKQLENHKLQRHTSNSRLYTCDQCAKEFRYEMRLRRHVQDEHGGKRLYTCKGCVLKFGTKEECDAHMKQELHYKTQMCPECGKCFGTTNNLHVHIQRHRGAKPFKCKYCEKGFLRRADLKIHERYHTGEKSHFCEQCGRGFQRRCTLIIHMRTHTGEKPYKCPYCDQAFSQRQDLKTHVRRHTGDLFRCGLCSAGFLQAYALRQHKLAEHNIMEESIIKRLVKVNNTAEATDVGGVG